MSGADRRFLWPLIVGLGLRVAWMLAVPNEQWSDVAWYDGAARHLALTGELRFPDGEGTLRARFPPAWPFVLSLGYRVFGPLEDLFKLVNLALVAALFVSTAWIGRKTFGADAALAGTWLLAVLPGHLVYVSLAQYEMFLSVLILALLALALAGDWAGSWRSPRAHALGAVLALITLTRPAFVVFGIAVAVHALRGDRSRARLAVALVPLAWAAVGAGAWTARNAQVLGYATLDAHAGYNFWIGHNDHATGGVLRWPASDDPCLDPLAVSGEVEREEAAWSCGLAWAAAHPGRVVELIPRRVLEMWRSDSTGLYMAFLYAPMRWAGPLEPWRRGSSLPEAIVFRSYVVVIGLALLGWLVPPRPGADAWLVTGAIMVPTLLAAASFGTDRFHVPVMPLVCLFAGRGVVFSWRRALVGFGRPDPSAAE